MLTKLQSSLSVFKTSFLIRVLLNYVHACGRDMVHAEECTITTSSVHWCHIAVTITSRLIHRHLYSDYVSPPLNVIYNDQGWLYIILCRTIKWRPEAGWQLRPNRRLLWQTRGLLRWSMGDSVWRQLRLKWCKSGLSSAGVLNILSIRSSWNARVSVYSGILRTGTIILLIWKMELSSSSL